MHGFETNYSLGAVPIVDASSAGQLVMRIYLFPDACHRVHEDQSASFRMNCCMKRKHKFLLDKLCLAVVAAIWQLLGLSKGEPGMDK